MNNTYLILPNLIRWSHAACANVDNENMDEIQSTTELDNHTPTLGHDGIFVRVSS